LLVIPYQASLRSEDVTATQLAIIATNFCRVFCLSRNSTLRIGFHENIFPSHRDHCRLPPIFVVAGLDADVYGHGRGHGCLARMHQQDYAGVRGPKPEQNACQGADSGFSFEHFRRVWITFRAMQECPLLDKIDE
jgi:hypothetical protein